MKKLILYVIIILICFIGFESLLVAQNDNNSTTNNNQENNNDDDTRRQEGDDEDDSETRRQEDEDQEEFEPEIYNILNFIGTRNSNLFYEIPGYLNYSISYAGHTGPDAAKELFRYINREDMKDIIKLISRDVNTIIAENDDDETRRQEGEEEEDDGDDDTRRQEGEEEEEEIYIEEESFDTEDKVQEVYSPGPLDEYLDDDEIQLRTDRTEKDEKANIKYLVDNQTVNFDEDLSEERINEILFIIQLTGINYNEEGFPIRNNKGTYTSIVQTEWMKNEEIYTINVKYLIESLLKGLFNKDPVVRLECIKILQAMGPHPFMLEDVLKASGREVNLELSTEQLSQESSGETVGNIDRAFYLKKSRILQNKYKYIDLDGNEKIAVPFLQIRQFLAELVRVNIIYTIEIQEGLSKLDIISQSTMKGLSENLSYYSDEIDEDERSEITTNSNQIPLNIYLDGNSAFKIYGATSLLSFNNVQYDDIEDISLTNEEKIKITKSFINGLKNRNYTIRIKIADFLEQFYHSEYSNDNIKSLILIACIDSKDMREALYEEIYRLLSTDQNRLNDLLSRDEITSLREAMGM